MSLAVGLVEIVIGSCAAAGAATVIITYALFPDLRSLRYMELVFYVSLNDLVGSIGIALGPVPSGSLACWFQGLTTNMNFLSSIFWTTVISYQVWLVLEKRIIMTDMKLTHCICWGVPLVFTLLPLSTNTYGNSGSDFDSSWCFVANRKGSPRWGITLWTVLAYYLWVWAALLVSLYFLIRIYKRLRDLKSEIPDIATYTLQKLQWYPLITLACWGPASLIDLTLLAHNNGSTFTQPQLWNTFNTVAVALAVMQGLCNAVVFFTMNPITRTKWHSLLSGDTSVLYSQPIDAATAYGSTASASANIRSTEAGNSVSASTSASVSAEKYNLSAQFDFTPRVSQALLQRESGALTELATYPHSQQQLSQQQQQLGSDVTTDATLSPLQRAEDNCVDATDLRENSAAGWNSFA